MLFAALAGNVKGKWNYPWNVEELQGRTWMEAFDSTSSSFLDDKMSVAISRQEASPLRLRQHDTELLDTAAAVPGASGRRAAQEVLPREWRGLSLARFNGTVFGILALTLYIYATVVLCVILPWLSWSVPGVLNLALLTLSTGTALVCFLACVMVDPGRCGSCCKLAFAVQSERARTCCAVLRKWLPSAPPLHGLIALVTCT